jgi:HPt (histidine-containing phosphotransfer) domain-containing protein
LVAELVAAVSSGDTAAAASGAHALKGVAANLSAMRLSEAAAVIESLVASGQMYECERRLEPLQATLDECLQQIPDILHNLAAEAATS